MSHVVARPVYLLFTTVSAAETAECVAIQYTGRFVCVQVIMYQMGFVWAPPGEYD